MSGKRILLKSFENYIIHYEGFSEVFNVENELLMKISFSPDLKKIDIKMESKLSLSMTTVLSEALHSKYLAMG